MILEFHPLQIFLDGKPEKCGMEPVPKISSQVELGKKNTFDCPKVNRYIYSKILLAYKRLNS